MTHAAWLLALLLAAPSASAADKDKEKDKKKPEAAAKTAVSAEDLVRQADEKAAGGDAAGAKELPEKALARIADIDFVRLAGLVATLGEGADAAIIGSATDVARAEADGAAVAERAFTIEEDHQGQGLARGIDVTARYNGCGGAGRVRGEGGRGEQEKEKKRDVQAILHSSGWSCCRARFA